MLLFADIFMLLALGAIMTHVIDAARVSPIAVRKPWTKRVAIAIKRRSA